MKNIKTNKGITLLALIITIVILLILAVVTISNLGEHGLISKTNNAVTKYNNAKDDERLDLDKMEGYIDNFDFNIGDGLGDGCSHTNIKKIYAKINDEQHSVSIKCIDCGATSETVSEKHGYDNGYCGECNSYCLHSSKTAGKCNYCGKTTTVLAPKITLDFTTLSETVLDPSIPVYKTLTVVKLENVDGPITWESSNNGVARVWSTGDRSATVEIRGIGEAIITVTCGNATATCRVYGMGYNPGDFEGGPS